ncbi:hypothetical protein DI270_028320 [Microbispora triticiradicis]|uniref:Uncharacterized protein n=1 Tax=Microbispora triticiradicis TaxID=2200763 RepID=A0ABX9LCJ9_9ACTN|nr:hypothetical protein [Microbispora triticiradicis]RGA01692.1 hypothetical protein DI270_028320 [Microbispora triticiradicis]GLW23863.1 hypothetical protein Mame01_39060 [Microbispora amethystogenes]
MIIFSAAAALAATLIAGPAAFADPGPSAALSGTNGGTTADRTGGQAPAQQPDTVVGDPGYGPSGPDDNTGDGTGYSPAYAPATVPAAVPVVAPASFTGQSSQAGQPEQAVYHLKGKDGVRHDVVVVPISDDPSKPIALPDFGFQKFKVTDKPRTHRPRAHAARRHQGRKHHHGGRAHRRR